MTKEKFNVYDMITGRIIEKVRETGKLIWQKPWRAIHFQNAISGHKYRGVNILMLECFGTDTHYLTYKQAQSAGGWIKKGAKSIPVVYWQPGTKIKDKETGEEKKILLIRYSCVFPLSDVEGAEIKRKGVQLSVFKPLEMAENLVKACNVPITHGGNVAAYSPATHSIRMPNPEQFSSSEAYYKVLFHEIIHAMARACDEDLSKNKGFGSEQYSKEELTAELGCNFLLSYCGIDPEPMADNSAAYLQGWLSAISGDSKLLVNAAAKAHRRFDKVLELLGVEKEQDNEEQTPTETAETVLQCAA